VLADDPQLTCRLNGLEHRSPVRVALDRNLVIPPAARLIAEAEQAPTWVVTALSSDPERREALRRAGVEIIEATPDTAGRIDLADMLRRLGERGVTRLLVEGGGRLAASLLRAGLVDRLVWLHAPLLLGGDGVPAIDALGLDMLAEAPGFDLLSSETAGPDLLSTYRLRAG
jgi:diaminohydroxyphosphoribosylaminopyrimidine deaminase/5-amino-6-(5-phosphoribosylamino)uracil reductase